MTFIYLDTETTGLDPAVHHVWEVAWAVESGVIRHGMVPHSIATADPKALEVGRYEQRVRSGQDLLSQQSTERWLRAALNGRTIVGANPAFDQAFLTARWGEATWRYRLLDIEAYAMGALGYVEPPPSLFTIAADLRSLGYDVPEPDHTAAGDVATARAAHQALRGEYASLHAARAGRGA